MKQFIKTQKVTYNLMSFTAFKALLIFSMLIESPKSYEEISNSMLENRYIKEKISIDTMRVYINSLKRIGCEVKRTKAEDKISKYQITSYPFELKITEEQLQSIIKIYKSLSKSLNIRDIIAMDNMFEKIGKHIKDSNFIQKIRGYSILKDVNIELIKQLIEYCNAKKLITISYKSPNSGEKDIDIIPDNIEISNGKIYLFGYGLEYKQTTGFLVNRINVVKNVKDIEENTINSTTVKVKYKIISSNSEIVPEKYETIINKQNNTYLMEAETNNLFYLKQRLLEFGPQCKIISPIEFKRDFVKLLKDMKAGYSND